MTKYLDENGLLYLWGKLKATFLHNASEGRFTGVSTNTSTGLRTFNVPTIAEHIYYDSNKNSTLKDKIDTIVSQGGEPNTIETVKVNGTALTPDANKAVNIDLSGYLPLTGGTLTGGLTVNGSIIMPTGSLHVQYGDLHVDKIHHNIDPNDASASKVWTTNGEIADINTFLSGYLPLSGGTMTQSGPINFNTGGYIQYDSTTTGIKMVSPETITITGTEGIQINSGGSNDIKLEGAREILLSGSQTTIYSDLYMRDGGIIAYDSADRSSTKVWDTNGGMVDLSTYANTDTKNTAGATGVTFNASTEKLYLIGAKEQTANPQTYTNNSTYIDNSSGLHTGSIYAGTINSSSQITASSFRVENSELGVMFVNLTNGGEIEMTVDTLHASSGNVPPTVPTASAGDNSTKIATTAFVTNAINNAIGGVAGITYEVVQTLPATGAAGTIYLISNSGTNPNIYDEYIYVNNGFEKIGTTDVDLTNYWSKTELVVIPNTTIDYIVTNNTLPTT